MKLMESGRPLMRQHDDRLPGRDHGFDELLLGADQVERVAVAEMFFRPRLTVRALVLAHHNDGDVGLSRGIRGGANAGGLRCRVGDINCIFVPRRPALLAGGDLAAFGKYDLHSRLNPLADSVENADLVPWAGIAAVSAEMNVGGIWPDDSDRFQFRRVERQKIALILQAAQSLSARPSAPVAGARVYW